MRRARPIVLSLIAFATFMVFAPDALALTHGGQGLYGETDDKVITNAMFITIVFFPVIILIFSLLQGWLDHRKHARLAAAKRRAASVDWRGGW